MTAASLSHYVSMPLFLSCTTLYLYPGLRGKMQVDVPNTRLTDRQQDAMAASTPHTIDASV